MVLAKCALGSGVDAVVCRCRTRDAKCKNSASTVSLSCPLDLHSALSHHCTPSHRYTPSTPHYPSLTSLHCHTTAPPHIVIPHPHHTTPRSLRCRHQHHRVSASPVHCQVPRARAAIAHLRSSNASHPIQARHGHCWSM